MNDFKTYSTVPESFFGNRKKINTDSKRNKNCQFAEDTGKIALPHRPCRGNKIICHHPDLFGFFFTEKQCSPLWCKYYRKQED